MSVSDVTERLRRPEYTGENRCLPCTVVNVLLAGVLAAGLSVVATPFAGLVAFVAALIVVYLRGYLVPGTPTLTKEYLPPRVLALFGKEPVETVRVDSEAASDGAESATDDPFAAAGVLALESDEPTLTPEFEAAWRERAVRVAERGVEPSDVARAFDAEEATATGDRSFVLDGNKSVRWGSEAAMFADVAAASLLETRVDEWSEYGRDRRQSVFLGLRLCLEECPACGGRLSVRRDRVDPCCQKPHLTAESVCEECGAALADAAVVDDGETETVRDNLLRA